MVYPNKAFLLEVAFVRYFVTAMEKVANVVWLVMLLVGFCKGPGPRGGFRWLLLCHSDKIPDRS